MDSARCRDIWQVMSRTLHSYCRSEAVLCLQNRVLNVSGLKRLRLEQLVQETVTASLRRAQFRRKHQDRYEQKGPSKGCQLVLLVNTSTFYCRHMNGRVTDLETNTSAICSFADVLQKCTITTLTCVAICSAM